MDPATSPTAERTGGPTRAPRPWVWWLCVIAVLALAAYRLIGPALQDVSLNPDSERDMFRAARFAERGELYWPGPSIMGEASTQGIGPAWYVLAAPVLFLDANATAPYRLHVVLFVAGLGLLTWALARPATPWAALITGSLLASGRYPLSILQIVLHPAMLLGFGLAWFALCIRIALSTDAVWRGRALAWAWLLVALTPQLHLSALAYVATTGWLTLVHWRRFGLRTTRIATAISAAIGIGLAAVYANLLLDQPAGPATSADVSRIGAWLGALWDSLLWMSAGGLDTPEVWPLVLLGPGLCASALLTWPRFGGPATDVARLAWVQLVLGCVLYGELGMRMPTVPRYALAAVPAAYVCAALGLGWLLTQLWRLRRTAWVAPTLFVATTFVLPQIELPFTEPRPPEFEAPRLREQETVLACLRDNFGFTRADIGKNLHGPLWAGENLAYPLAAAGFPASDAATTQAPHVVAIPAGFVAPEGTCQPCDNGFGRPVDLCALTPRVAYGPVAAILGTHACHLPLPFHAAPDSKHAKGLTPLFRSGGDCGSLPFAGEAAEWRLQLSLVDRGPTKTLTVLVAWAGPGSEKSCERARVELGGREADKATCDRRTGTLGQFEFTGVSGNPELIVSPAETLSLLDVY